MKNIYARIRAFADKQIIRFMMVGVSNTVVSYAAYLIVMYVSSGNYIISNTAGFISGTFNAYLWNSKFVFKERKKSFNKWHILKTFMSYGITFMLNTGVLYMLINYIHIPALIAPLLNAALMFMVNFALNKFWVYGKKGETNE